MQSRKSLLVNSVESGPTTVEDVFSISLYEGTGAFVAQDTAIDLSENGGMVWIKQRDGTADHFIQWRDSPGDSFDGVALASNTPAATTSSTGYIFGLSPTGYLLGSGDARLNASGNDYVAWQFKRAPRFFDIVRYTGDGVASRSIAHELGVEPGLVFLKAIDTVEEWCVNFVTSLYEEISSNWRQVNSSGGAGTSTIFYVRNNFGLPGNTLGVEYVAYLFADDPLGLSGDGSDSMISCGTYTGNASAGLQVDVGWEPQFVMIKSQDTGRWHTMDSMRGPVGLFAGTTDSDAGNYLRPTYNGFELLSGDTEISGFNDSIHYVAIRRPMREPTVGTDVFAMDTAGSTGDGKAPNFRSGFPVDMFINIDKNTAGTTELGARFVGDNWWVTQTTSGKAAAPAIAFDHNNGHYDTIYTDIADISYMWKRAKGFFDIVTYMGSAPGTLDHQLGVIPELIVYKLIGASGPWYTIIHNQAIDSIGQLQSSSGFSDGNYAATVDNFTPYASSSINEGYVYFLFASMPGISKIGFYTGNGGSQTIDCGFVGGARFVMIKCISSASNWLLFDTVRGIVAGDDSHVALNDTTAEVTTNDSIDPDSLGFIINHDAGSSSIDWVNWTGYLYFYYAIA